MLTLSGIRSDEMKNVVVVHIIFMLIFFQLSFYLFYFKYTNAYIFKNRCSIDVLVQSELREVKIRGHEQREKTKNQQIVANIQCRSRKINENKINRRNIDEAMLKVICEKRVRKRDKEKRERERRKRQPTKKRIYSSKPALYKLFSVNSIHCSVHFR